MTACINGGPNPSNTPSTNAATTKSATAETPASATTNQQSPMVFSKHPVVNVYLETSGSMNGYVDNGKSQFQQVVFDYLSNIKNSGLPSEINLNYITDKITPKGSNVDPFINTLTSRGILNASGSKATTDIAALVSTILQKTDSNTVSIFISDCIFSPGSDPSPVAYLENQKIAVRNAINDYIEANGFVGCTVYQVFSQFSGSYFDFKNRRSSINMQRPFYIWVFCSPVHIATIKAKVPDSGFMGSPVVNTWTIVNGDFSEYEGLNDYGLLQPSPTNGAYRWNSKTTVSRIRRSGEQFMFTFGVDMKFPILLYGEDYVTNLSNYKHLINKDTNEEFYGTFRKDLVAASPYTHDITVLSQKPFSNGEFTIVFDGNVPEWVYESTDLDDSVLSDGNCRKTYGFSYMCDGIYAGFHANNKSNITATYDFVIN